MKDFWNKFLTDNSGLYRMLRTIVQGIIGVVIANIDTIIGSMTISATTKPMIAALVMAVLSPIMASLSQKEIE